MTEPRPDDTHQHTGHGGHGWMMIVCCIPMLIIAIALVAAGVVSAGFLLLAVGCMAMMFLMMRMMMVGVDASGRRNDARVEKDL